MELSGKNVIYEGGFGGIGQHCLREFLSKGVKNLAIFDLKENSDVFEELQNSYPEANIFFVKFDITKRDSIRAAFKVAIEQMGHFDVLVNGCGMLDDTHVELTIEINLMGLIHSTLIAMPYMDKSAGGRGGVIVNISSAAGLEPTATIAIYSAAKHGVTAFTRCMANPFYFARHGISFIGICPGITDTALVENPEQKVTFEFAKNLGAGLNKVASQSPQLCAKNLVNIAETGKNGDFYLLDLGKIDKVTFPVMWQPVLKS